MPDLAAEKRTARAAAHALRATAAGHPGCARRAAAHVLDAVAPLRAVRTVAGYLPIRSEIDPLPAMRALIGLGFTVAVPEVVAPGTPLAFRAWTPGVATAAGSFGVAVPVGTDRVVPDLLLVPLLAFDRRGHRLGYGGGFYDRTIAALRAGQPLTAIGLAYAAQEVPRVPDGETDSLLDAIVTENGVIRPAQA
jgi:5-formyltetrahydrofolate cyclo-ligase